MNLRRSERLPGVGFLVVLPGLESEGEAVRAELERSDPSTVGLVASPEELAGYAEYFVGQAGEPLVPLSGAEEAELRGLARFGEVAAPSPALLSALEWAGARGRPTLALDWSDAEYDESFAADVSYLELVRRTRRERALVRHPPSAEGPEAFIDRWDRTLRGHRGSARLAQRREQAAASRIRSASAATPRLVVVVERERAVGILAALEAGAVVTGDAGQPL